MKKLLGAIILFSAMSCSTNSKIESEIDKKMSESLKDYSSYEQIETKTIDTIHVGEIAKLEIANPVNLRHPSPTKMAKFKQLENSDEVLSYVVYHKYRAKNGIGAFDVYENEYVFDKDLKLFGDISQAYNSKSISTRLFYQKYIN